MSQPILKKNCNNLKKVSIESIGMSDNHPDIKVTLKNDALDSQGKYAGEYKQSFDCHGKPSFIQDLTNAIWYNSKRNSWIIGPYNFYESESGEIYTDNGSAVFGNPTDVRNLWYYRTSSNEWKVIPPDDIKVKFIMPGK